MKKMWGFMLAWLLVLASSTALAEGGWLDDFLKSNQSTEEDAYLAVLCIEGEISTYSYDYDHLGTLDVIDALSYDEDNVGLLLLLDTPGGSLYEADELVHVLDMYKQTGRPVYAFMEQECCSAGVYVAMAAEHIMAARMTVTGSIGVYTESFSEAGLYEKLGLEDEYIATGENKLIGYPTLTEEQRAIYQALVDEAFEFFKAEITRSRGLTEEQMAPFLDGRLLSALQAKDLGLIDEVCYYDEAIDWVLDQFHGWVDLVNVTPEPDYGFYGRSGEDDEDDLINWLEQLSPSTKKDGLDRGRAALRSILR